MLSNLRAGAREETSVDRFRKGLMTDANEIPIQLVGSNATSDIRGVTGSKSTLCPEYWGVGGLIYFNGKVFSVVKF